MTTFLLEEELAPLPTRPAPKATYRGYGFAEVKPHNARGIAAGLDDLRKRYQKTRGRKPQDVYLVTYVYEKGKDRFSILALRPHDSTLLSASPVTVREDPGWVDSLGTWYDLGSAALPLQPGNKSWIEQVGPVTRGLMLEPIARDVFIAWLRPKKHRTAAKLPHEGGADIRWQEIAEYLYELASEVSEWRRPSEDNRPPLR